MFFEVKLSKKVKTLMNLASAYLIREDKKLAFFFWKMDTFLSTEKFRIKKKLAK
jgi:hypothetical protein